MGEAKRRRRKFLDGKPFCILCGGNAPAETEDHIPPKAMFKDHLWPEEHSYPACKKCNNDSRQEDLLVSFLARLGHEDVTESQLIETQRLMRGMTNNHSKLTREMMNVSVRQKRNFSVKTGMQPFGDSYKDVPILHLPIEIRSAIETFAAKLTKALYYKITNQPFPNDGAISLRWYTNAQLLQNPHDYLEDVMKMLHFTNEIKREKLSLRNQFDYVYSMSDDNSLGLMACKIGVSLLFIVIFSLDPSVVDDTISKAVEQTKNHNNVFKRIYWPKQ
jgi:hypothetical protein